MAPSARYDAKLQRGDLSARAFVVCALVVVAFVVIQLEISVSTNVSWLLVIGDKMWGGARLYTDLLEVNPPASVWLYLPAIWLEHGLGLRAEYGVLAGVTALLILSIGFSGRLLARAGIVRNPLVWTLSALVAFGLVAGDSFAEREHIAAFLLLPLLSLVALRMQPEARMSALEVFIAGVAAGLAVVIKPHFAAAVALPQIYAAARRRSLAPLLGVENALILAIAAAYASIAFMFYGDYWANLIPILADTYLKATSPILGLIVGIFPGFALVSIYIIVACKGVGKLADIFPIYLFSAAGFLLAHFAQGKSWPYHYYPAAALALLALLNDASPRWLAPSGESAGRGRRALPLTIIALMLLGVDVRAFMPPASDVEALKPAIARRFPHPRVLAITGNLSVSHPLTREIGGVWVGTFASQWITENVHSLLRKAPQIEPQRRARLEALEQMDRNILIGDLRKGDPDIVLLDKRTSYVDWKAWAKQPELAALLCAYEPIDSTPAVELYARRAGGGADGECAFR